MVAAGGSARDCSARRGGTTAARRGANRSRADRDAERGGFRELRRELAPVDRVAGGPDPDLQPNELREPAALVAAGLPDCSPSRESVGGIGGCACIHISPSPRHALVGWPAGDE